MGARYRYALSAHGALLDVADLTAAERRSGAPYVCMGCAGEMVPRLGAVRVHHFAHRAEGECAGETYLHRLAKRVLHDEVASALAAGRPFLLVYPETARCTHFRDAHGFVCASERPRELDLTAYFDRVSVETAHGGFRPDLLLHSTRHDDCVYLEVAVSHPCSPEKVASGVRIVEVPVRDEAQVARLRQGGLDAGTLGLRLHNFRSPAPRPACGGDCPFPVDVLLVREDRSAVVASVAGGTAASPGYAADAVRREVLGPSDRPAAERRDRFAAAVRGAWFDGVPVRDCHLCAHQGMGTDAPVFCRKRTRGCESAEAVECPDFTPLASLRECEYLDRRSRRFLVVREAKRREGYAAAARRDWE